MPKFILLMVLIFSGCMGFGQDLDEKDYLGISGGAAFPVGKLKSASIKEGGGFAKTGSYISIDYIRFLNAGIGLSLSIIHRSNPMDETAFIKELRTIGADMNALETTPWKSTMGLTGLILRLPVHSKSFLYLKALGGFSHNAAPELTYIYGFGKGGRQEIRSASVAFQVGSGFKYRFSKFAAGADVSYTYTNPSFRSGPISFNQPMNSIIIGLAGSYCF